MQLFAVTFILLQDHSTYFGCRPHPSSGVHKTVTTASGTGHTNCAATFLQRGQIGQFVCPVLEVVVTVLCTPDDWRRRHPKHVEWSCSKIKLTANSCILLVYYQYRLGLSNATYPQKPIPYTTVSQVKNLNNLWCSHWEMNDFINNAWHYTSFTW